MTFARKLAERREQREAEKARNLEALCQPARSLHRGVYGGETGEAAPKSEPYRDAVLLEMARGRVCLLLAVAHCRRLMHDSSTTVACHRNEGKGMARKQSDCYSVWGCFDCHVWYDQSGAPREEKRRAFDAAMDRQVSAWERVVADPAEPERFRKAAFGALKALKAASKEEA